MTPAAAGSNTCGHGVQLLSDQHKVMAVEGCKKARRGTLLHHPHSYVCTDTPHPDHPPLQFCTSVTTTAPVPCPRLAHTLYKAACWPCPSHLQAHPTPAMAPSLTCSPTAAPTMACGLLLMRYSASRPSSRPPAATHARQQRPRRRHHLLDAVSTVPSQQSNDAVVLHEELLHRVVPT